MSTDSTTIEREETEPAASGNVVLEVENLRTEFHLRSGNVRAVDGVTFTVQAGECVGLVGESGCGKSTTGLSIMKLLPTVGHVVGGSIRLLGKDLGPLSEREMRHVRGNDAAMIFQDPMMSLNPTWTIGRQIAEAYRLHNDCSQKEALARAREVLELVGLPRPAERLRAYPHQLSGGLRQRVMIAMALVNSPRLLIADEPTTALDVTIQAQILDLIDNLRRDLQMAVILITHDLGVIAARANRVMVMYAGKIAEGAGTEELFGSMRHPYTEALFRSIPRFDQDRTRALFSIPGVPPDLMDPPPGCRFAPRCRNAQTRCVEEEPLLAPETGDGSRPGAGTEHTETPGTSQALRPGEHVFACFFPVDVSSSSEPTAEEVEAAATPGAVDLLDRPPAEELDTGVPISVTEVAPASVEAVTGRDVLLRLDNIVKEFPVTAGAVLQRKIGTVKAVSGVSFDVHRGETFGLVGESGCGKTTIGWLVTALHRPTSGEILFDGRDISTLRWRALRRARRDLQLMFQDPYASLDPRMRVGPTIREPLNIQSVGSRRERNKRVAELLSEVGLSAKAAGLYPHEFSGGQRQRIGLARALALNPKLIVADEPVSALDVSIQAQILNLMRSLQQTHELTYIVISHDLAVVRYLADTIGVMYLGKLVEIGPAARVYERPAHPYTRGLIDAVPIPDPVLEKQRETVAVRGELPSAIDPPSGCRFRTRCPLAQDVCAEVEPPLRSFGGGQRAACHFPLEEPEETTEAAIASQAQPG
ncbi:MAG TPA: dipeptide ABC transporter ATP-binding protein [Gaiellaceae bacterium]|nr:dipeptide ABC transporter ATP-binding protein [Gaiellaceae bacterium]